MKLYQLIASGRYHPEIGLSGHSRIINRQVYSNKSEAQNATENFLKLATTMQHDKADFFTIDPSGCKVEIIELEYDI